MLIRSLSLIKILIKSLISASGSLLAFILVIAIWTASIKIWSIPPYILPSPSMIWTHILLDLPVLLVAFRQTFLTFFLGFLLGSVAGFSFAVIMDALSWIRILFYPILIVSQSVPVIAISSALTIWLGFGLSPKLVIVALVVFFPVVVNVLAGLNAVDRDMLKLARSMGGGGFRIFRHVKLPATYTPLFSSLKLSATFSVTGAVMGEWTASTSGGLGAYLLQANSRLNTAGTFAAIAFLALLGLLSFLIVLAIEHLMTPWHHCPKARFWSCHYWRD